MIDTFWWFVSILVFVCVLGLFACFYRYFLGNRLVQMAYELQIKADKLNGQMGAIKRQFPELEAKRGSLVASGLGDIGISGILEELGVPAIVTPIAEGFIKQILNDPSKLKMLSERLGVKLPEPQSGSSAGFTAQM